MKNPTPITWKTAASLACLALLIFVSSASAALTITTAHQEGSMPFTPSWTPASDSLILGLAPTVATGNFALDLTTRDVNSLTSGGSLTIDTLPGDTGPDTVGNNTTSSNYVTCGNGAGAGSLIIYTLPASALGYNVTNITVDSGWADGGRDGQAYTVLYSTMANPTSFIVLATVQYNPSYGSGGSANQAVINDSLGAPIAANVAAVEFVFTTPRVENGWTGYGAITVEGTTNASVAAPVISITTSNESDGNNPFTPDYPLETPNLIAGMAPTTATGNFTLEGSGGTPVLTDSTIGTSGTIAGFATCGGGNGSGAGSVLIYTLTNVVNGTDVTNIVTYSGWGDGGRDGQYYIVSYSTIAAPTTFIPITTIYYLPSFGGGAPANRVSIAMNDGSRLASGVAKIKFDFISPPDSSGFNNGYQGYSELVVQGTDTATPPPPPSPYMTQDTLPSYAGTVVGDQVVFTAAYSNSPSPILHWQKIVGSVTNDLGTGSIVLSGNVYTSTLTLNNVQLTDIGSYQLKAVNGAFPLTAAPSFSTAAPLAVNPVPAADGNGVIVSPATQEAISATFPTFNSTWTVASGSLIAGASPSANGSGVFTIEGCGGTPKLTDGAFGSVGGGINTTLCSLGVNAGQSVTYTLTGPASGYDLTNIVTYGGWTDGGRDEQGYTVSYSTVLDPNTFILITTADYNPSLHSGVSSAVRLALNSSTAAPLATNVARVKFDFTNPALENGWCGFSELSLFGSNSAALPIKPFVTADTLPVTASDVEGSQIRFTAAFNGTAPITYQWQVDTGSGPIDIPGATGTTLTLNNLQLTDAASPGYSLRASNSVGVTSSSASLLIVNPFPAANGDNIFEAQANQTGNGAFSPTWILGAGSLISGLSPSSVGVGSFVNEGSGGTSVLTTGTFGSVGGGHASLATCGSGAGESVTYTLPVSAAGYNINSIVTYGGWGDGGRDEQHYTVLYSTVADPATFIPLTTADYNPTLPGSVPSADRITLTPVAGSLATNVVAVKFDFTTPSGENGWSGYAELDLFGAATPPPVPPTVNPPHISGGNLILTGTGGTPNAGYTWLTTTNLTTLLANWTVSATGVLDGSGAFSNAIPVNTTQPGSFFRLRMP